MKSILIIIKIMFLSLMLIQGKAQNTVSGIVHYFNSSQIPLDGVLVYLTNESGILTDSTYTDAWGNFTFESLQQGDNKINTMSTKTWNGANATDALQVMQHFTGMILLSGLCLETADVNNSETVNSIDALMIMKRFTGMQDTFGNGDWVFEKDSFSLAVNDTLNLEINGLCTGDVNSSYSPLPSPCPNIGYAGQVYHGVQIGNQCWMKENLNIGMMVFDDYTGLSHTHCSNNGYTEKYCYNNDPLMCEIWGGLYDWNEMMQYSTVSGVQGICPQGWHIPTDAEMCVLTTFLDPSTSCSALGYSGTNASGKMKEAGTLHWNSPNTGATNESGFTSIASGYRHYNGFNGSVFDGAYVWTSSEYAPTEGITRNLGLFNANISRFHYKKTYGFTVRCLKN